jgi:hypothetical protein
MAGEGLEMSPSESNVLISSDEQGDGVEQIPREQIHGIGETTALIMGVPTAIVETPATDATRWVSWRIE